MSIERVVTGRFGFVKVTPMPENGEILKNVKTRVKWRREQKINSDDGPWIVHSPDSEKPNTVKIGPYDDKGNFLSGRSPALYSFQKEYANFVADLKKGPIKGKNYGTGGRVIYRYVPAKPNLLQKVLRALHR